MGTVFSRRITIQRAVLLRRSLDDEPKVCRLPLCEEEKDDIIEKVCEALELTADQCEAEIERVRMTNDGRYLDECGPETSECMGAAAQAAKTACRNIVVTPTTAAPTTTAPGSPCSTLTSSPQAPLAQRAFDSVVDCGLNKALPQNPPDVDGTAANTRAYAFVQPFFSCCTEGVSDTLSLAEEAAKQCKLAVECSALRGARTKENAKFCLDQLINLEDLADQSKKICDGAIKDLQELEPLRVTAQALETQCQTQLAWNLANAKVGANHPSCIAMHEARRMHLEQDARATESSRLCRDKTTPLSQLARSAASACSSAMPPRRRLHGCDQAYDAAMVLFDEDSQMAREDFRAQVDYCEDILPKVRRLDLHECVQGMYLSDGRFLADTDHWPRSEMHFYITLFSVVFSWVMGVVLFWCVKDYIPQDPLPQEMQRRRAGRGNVHYV